jgi:hypothetical protein
MERTGCRQALAYDRHFVEASRQYGFVTISDDPADGSAEAPPV